MKIPISWLKEFVEVPVDAARLGEDLTLVGLALEGIDSNGTDTVLDLDVTTNRVDCMNVYGVAREASVIYGVPLRPPNLAFTETGPEAAAVAEVEIEAPDLCGRFCARVFDVQIAPSPAWMQKRLELLGVRPINNIVDVTNYVMLELGQPSHAFDLAKVADGRLLARWSRPGETLVTLDGALRTLNGRIGVMAGLSGALGLAGIMGGAASEVSEGTQSVLLEAAWWEPLAVRRAAKSLGMHTEASHRFERGADPEIASLACARIGHLLERIGGGSARPGLLDVSARPRRPRELTLRFERIDRLLGTSVPEPEAGRILVALGFGLDSSEAGTARLRVPSWRGDVAREADAIEEVARHHGLGRIPPAVPPARDLGGLRPSQRRERLVRRTLLAAGFSEAINYAFVSDAKALAGGARVRIDNPLSEQQDVLRDSLILPGLLGNLQTNLRQSRRDVRLFELGRVFAASEAGQPREERRLGLLVSGAAGEGHWSQKARVADVFDGKGVIESLFLALGLGELGLDPAGAPAFLHPGRSGTLLAFGQPAGYLGALHPDVAQAFEARDEVIVAELCLGGILAASVPAARFVALPRYPAVSRDLSILHEQGLTSASLVRTIREAAGEALREATVVDRYDRPPVPPGRVSVTVTLRYQAERTLTGEEVQRSIEGVVERLRSMGAEVRGLQEG